MGKRGGRSGKPRGLYVLLVVTIAVIAIAMIAYMIHSERQRTVERPAPAGQGKPQPIKPDVSGKTVPERTKGIHEPEGEVRPKAEKKRSDIKKVAIIIDDIGYDLNNLHELIQIDAPMTFAVFPYGPHSAEAARILHRYGRQILLHLPMEPRQYPKVRIDKGALLMSMDHEMIKRQLEQDLQAIPHIVGVNNHMGSRFMEDTDKLFVVMQGLKDKGLFFIDSRTTPLSKGREIAMKAGIPFAERNIFIDNDKDHREILKILMRIVEQKKAGNCDDVILIGHPRSGTIQALKQAMPLFKEQGIEVVSVSGMTRQVQTWKLSRKSSPHHAK